MYGSYTMTPAITYLMAKEGRFRLADSTAADPEAAARTWRQLRGVSRMRCRFGLVTTLVRPWDDSILRSVKRSRVCSAPPRGADCARDKHDLCRFVAAVE